MNPDPAKNLNPNLDSDSRKTLNPDPDPSYYYLKEKKILHHYVSMMILSIFNNFSKKIFLADKNVHTASNGLKGNRTKPDFINMDEINRGGWKCLGEIMTKWIQYMSMFYKVGRNMLATKVFNNEILLDGGGTSTVKGMGRVREQELEGRLKLLNLRDFLGEDYMLKSKNEIDLLFGTRTTFVEFFRLRNEIARLKTNIEYRSRLSRR